MTRNRLRTRATNKSGQVYESTTGRIYRAWGVLVIVLTHIIAMFNAVTWATRGASAIAWDGPVNFLLGYIFSWLLGLSCINLHPTIWLSEEGIAISHNLFWRIFVPWKDVVAVRVQDASVGAIVLVKRLTLFHYGYGLVALSFRPAFWIARDVRNHDLLLRQIKKHIAPSAGS